MDRTTAIGVVMDIVVESKAKSPLSINSAGFA
jgi:hypothetical protein